MVNISAEPPMMTAIGGFEKRDAKSVSNFTRESRLRTQIGTGNSQVLLRNRLSLSQTLLRKALEFARPEPQINRIPPAIDWRPFAEFAGKVRIGGKFLSAKGRVLSMG
jgi:hypothetical protein